MSFTASASGAIPEPAPAVVPDRAPDAAPATLAGTTPATLREAAAAPIDVSAPSDAPSALVDPAAAPIDASPAPVEQAAAAAPEFDGLAVFVGPNAARFLRPLTAGQARGRGGICWPGFLLPGPWLLYRKMYGLTALIVLMPVLFSLMRAPSALVSVIGVAYAILGAFGKRLYLRKARRTIASIRAAAPDEASARAAIGQAGGVSVAGAVFGLLLIAAFVAFHVLRA
jgi:hypothetical protein